MKYQGGGHGGFEIFFLPSFETQDKKKPPRSDPRRLVRRKARI